MAETTNFFGPVDQCLAGDQDSSKEEIGLGRNVHVNDQAVLTPAFSLPLAGSIIMVTFLGLGVLVTGSVSTASGIEGVIEICLALTSI